MRNKPITLSIQPRALLWAGLAAAAWGVGTLVYGFGIERKWLNINRLTLELPRLDPVFEGCRIVHLSDFHAETWFPQTYFNRIIDTVNALEPDLIVLTGDYVHETVRPVAASLPRALRRLRARDGVFGVLGNHDHWEDGEAVRRAIIAGGVHDLRNAVYTLRRGESMLHLAGVDSYLENKARLDLVLSQLPDEGTALLLAHEPDFAHVSAASGRFDVQFSGHSHGGQIRLPLLMQAALPKFADRYNDGLYQVTDDMLLYVNRGVGVSEIPLRLNCRPEITLFTLCREATPHQPLKKMPAAPVLPRRIHQKR